MVAVILVILLNLVSSFVSSYAQDALSSNRTQQLELQISELKQKISGLETRIQGIQGSNILDYGNELLKQGIALIGIAGAAGFAAFFAWRRERMIPPTVDQEKIINEIATKWYYHRHLNVYNEIWKKIEASEDQESEINKAWEYLCVKEFPTDNYDGIKGFNAEQVKEDIANYLAQRLHLSKKELLRKKDRKDKNEEDRNEDHSLENRLDIITDASSVSYYDRVREVLPGVARKAVLATLGEKKFTKEEHEKVFEESLKKLKRMMVFYRLREDKKVAEAILYGAVYDNMKDLSIGDKELGNINTSSSRITTVKK